MRGTSGKDSGKSSGKASDKGAQRTQSFTHRKRKTNDKGYLRLSRVFRGVVDVALHLAEASCYATQFDTSQRRKADSRTSLFICDVDLALRKAFAKRPALMISFYQLITEDENSALRIGPAKREEIITLAARQFEKRNLHPVHKYFAVSARHSLSKGIAPQAPKANPLGTESVLNSHGWGTESFMRPRFIGTQAVA